jgi:hypothetical protein
VETKAFRLEIYLNSSNAYVSIRLTPNLIDVRRAGKEEYWATRRSGAAGLLPAVHAVILTFQRGGRPVRPGIFQFGAFLVKSCTVAEARRVVMRADALTASIVRGRD